MLMHHIMMMISAKEWIRKNSNRLQKKRVIASTWQTQSDGKATDLWATFEVGRWVRVKRSRTGHEPFVQVYIDIMSFI